MIMLKGFLLLFECSLQVDLVGAEQLEAGHLATEAEPRQTHRLGAMGHQAVDTGRLMDSANTSIDVIFSW